MLPKDWQNRDLGGAKLIFTLFAAYFSISRGGGKTSKFPIFYQKFPHFTEPQGGWGRMPPLPHARKCADTCFYRIAYRKIGTEHKRQSFVFSIQNRLKIGSIQQRLLLLLKIERFGVI